MATNTPSRPRNELKEYLYEHVPFLRDVEQKGLKRAALAKADEAVNRITAGLGVADIRSALRGEPPPRPNPRAKPHTDGFILHIRPAYYHKDVTGVYPSFRLGWLSFYFFMLETITGIFLMVFYTPSPEAAYANMLNILSNVPFGRLMRDLHRVGAEAMVAFVALHMLRTFITGNYKKPRQFTWATGVILLIFTIFLSFSGYLLPWDQLAFWAVTIGTSMAEASPTPFPINILTGNGDFVGENLNLLMRGAPEIGSGGLLRFYLLHVFLLPLLTFLFFFVHYYKVVLHGHSLPPEKEPVGEDTARKVPMDRRTYFIPDILTSEVLLTAAVSLITIAIALFFQHAPLEHHADPQSTPLHTVAPWYFLWIQGMLKLGDKTFFGVILPFGIIFPFLAVLPYLEVAPSRRYADRRVGISLGLFFSALVIVLTWMGGPAYKVQTSADQEIGQLLLPGERVGPIRALAYDQLVPGTYDAYQAPESAPQLQAVLDEFRRLVTEHYREELTNGQGILVIEQWQGDLKKITLRILFQARENPNDPNSPLVDRTFEQTAYVHQESNYEGEH
jgi:quinol-cytochrome oxidoreductase complex cytochrome b subunit